MPFALSVHNFISSVGADAGFASIIGLAILTLLYFAHARDTANLRQESEELSHRLAQAETRLAQVSRQATPAAQAVPTAAPPPQTARPAGPPIKAMRAGAAGVAGPGAPAGVGAPALAAATRVVPLAFVPSGPSGEEAPADPPAEPAVPAAADPAPAEEAEAVLAARGASAVASSAPVSERRAGRGGPTPATAAGAANGGGRDPRVVSPVGARQTVAPARERVQIRPGAGTAPGRRASVPPRAPTRREGGPGRRFALLIGALIAAGAIAVLVIVTQSGGSSQPRAASSSTTNAPGATHRAGPAAFSPSSVTVAVLNGTATNELAHRVAAKLSTAGYKQGTVATGPNQTQSATIVAFRPGFRADALHVATSLKLGPASVQPIDSNTQAVACPPPSPCPANVVVTVGQDLATL